jgi:hypothetical protein
MKLRFEHIAFAFLFCIATAQAAEPAKPASGGVATTQLMGKVTVVELFTSKYCPNCKPAEMRLARAAAEDPTLLVLQQHVDYWDMGEDRKDPFGLAEVTARQYDYSNTLSRRPGEVFTPMPIFNGRRVAGPPLMFSWDSTLQASQNDPAPEALRVTRTANGDVHVRRADGSAPDGEVWLLGVAPLTGYAALPNLRRVMGLVQANDRGNVAKALLPKGPELVALWQANGPGAVRGVGLLNSAP